MNANVKWALATLASVAAAVAITWNVARNSLAAPVQAPDQNPDRAVQNPDRAEDSVKIVVAVSRALVQFSNKGNPSILAQILDELKLRTPSGKKIEIVRLPVNSPEIIAGMLDGSLKAHIIVPTNDVYLDLLDREWTLRSGKPLTSDRRVVVRQPYVLAVRRHLAEAMGWPKKDLGWGDVIEVAHRGWKAVGHPEWGSLKMVLSNPNYSDTGAHAVVSLATGFLQKPKLTSADLDDPAMTAAIQALDDSVV